MTKTILTSLFVLLLFSCVNRKENSDIKQSPAKDPFDSLMISLVSTYPVLPKVDSDKYSNIYYLVKRVFIPGGNSYEGSYDLNLELWQNTPCGGCWDYQVIYIYNEKIHFVLPLTDFFYYWKNSGDKPLAEDELTKSLNFKKELNHLIKSFNIKPQDFLINEIMTSMLDYNEVTKFDIPKMKMIADEKIQKGIKGTGGNELYFYNKNCRDKIYTNLKRVEVEIENGYHRVYSNGTLIFIFTYDKTGEVDIEVLNSECLAMARW